MPISPPVNPEFAGGQSAALLVGSRDESRLNRKISIKDSRDLIDSTTFCSPDASQSRIYGELSGMINPEGFLSQDAATVSAQMATFIGKNRYSHRLLVAPSGFVVGYEANFCETKASDFDVDITFSGITTAAAGFATSRSGILDGHVLHSPHGIAGISGNEIQNLVFTAADVNQFFGLRAEGTAPAFGFRLVNYANDALLIAALKTGIEGLAAYAGRTVTITGTLAGTTTKTGTLVLSFSGAVNVPGLEPVSGAVRRRRVTVADGGTYSFDGAMPRVLPISQATFDADQKAIDAAHAASISIGSSGYSTTFILSGTGPAVGQYTESGIQYDGKKYLAADGRQIIAISDGGGIPIWLACDAAGSGYAKIPRNGSTVPPAGVWIGDNGYPNVTSSGIIGSLDYTTYFPFGAVPGAATQTGTGATNAIVVTPGSAATTVSGLTIQQGGQNGLTYNLVTASGQDAWVDGENGGARFDALLSIVKLIGVGATLTAFIDHADDTGANTPGASTQAYAFSASTAADIPSLVQFARGVTTGLKRWRRARWTLTGTTPIAVFAVAAAV